MPRLIMLGAPGSGKGTQSSVLSKEYGIPIVATGDMLRDAIADKTEVGMKAKSYMDKGLLVPDEIVIKIALNRLSQDDTKDGYLLDGFPRTVEQAEALEEFLESEGLKLDKVVYLSVPKDVLIKRIAGRRLCKNCGRIYHVETRKPKQDGLCDVCSGELYQRKDDKSELALSRIEVYNESTKPLVQHYRDKGLLLKVDGTIGVDNIEEEIRKAI